MVSEQHSCKKQLSCSGELLFVVCGHPPCATLQCCRGGWVFVKLNFIFPLAFGKSDNQITNRAGRRVVISAPAQYRFLHLCDGQSHKGQPGHDHLLTPRFQSEYNIIPIVNWLLTSLTVSRYPVVGLSSPGRALAVCSIWILIKSSSSALAISSSRFSRSCAISCSRFSTNFSVTSRDPISQILPSTTS